MNTCIDHLNRHVSDVNKFIAFYCETLRYELIAKGLKANGKAYAILKGYGHELFISEKDDFSAGDSNFRHIGYSIQDVEALLKKLQEKGYAGLECQVVVKQFSKQFYIKDPDGFEIDFIQWTNKEGFYNSLSIENQK